MFFKVQISTSSVLKLLVYCVIASSIDDHVFDLWSGQVAQWVR